MKKKGVLILVILLICTMSVSALGANISQHLSSRFTVLSAKLYQTMSSLSTGEVSYQVTLLPVMDVNGENPLLAQYLHKRMEEVIGKFPSIRLIPFMDVNAVWTGLKAEGLSTQEIIRELGQRSGIPAVMMTSMVTHPTHYTLSGIVFNTQTLEQRQLEVVVLDRAILDTLSNEEIAQVLNLSTPTSVADAGTAETSKPVPGQTESATTTPLEEPAVSVTQPEEPAASEETTDGFTPVEPSDTVRNEPGDEVVLEPVDPEEPAGSANPPGADNDEMINVITEIIANAPVTPVDSTTPPENTTVPGTSTTPGNVTTPGSSTVPGSSSTPGTSTAPGSATTPGKSQENQIPVEPKPPLQVTDPMAQKPVVPALAASLVLQSESPLLDNLLLGFDLGDLNGDGQLELIYCGGMNIQVRSMATYEKLWDFTPFRPASKDYTVIAVDLDGDKSDEIIYHGNLLKLVENQLTAQQPRFLSRPVSLYGKTGVALYNDNAAFIVNYQGLVKKEYPIGGIGKRFLFTDLEGDGTEELVVIFEGEDENCKIKIFSLTDNGTGNSVTLEGSYGYSLIALDLNKNGRPEIYVRRNFFNGVNFLFSKIYVFESVDGKLQKIAESDKLDYFIVDFAQDSKTKPGHLVVGTMNLQSKQQPITEIQSKLFFYTLVQ